MQRRTTLKLGMGLIVAAIAPAWAAEGPTQVTLYKDPQCRYSGAYADYLRSNGFAVIVVETPHLPLINARYGVPHAFQSCHVAMVDRYFVEGHIPVVVIKRCPSSNALGQTAMFRNGGSGSFRFEFRRLSTDIAIVAV